MGKARSPHKTQRLTGEVSLELALGATGISQADITFDKDIETQTT